MKLRISTDDDDDDDDDDDTYQHGGPEVILLLELRDEDVHVHKLALVPDFHFPDDVRQPLEALLRPRHPQEVHLLVTGRTLPSLCVLSPRSR